MKGNDENIQTLLDAPGVKTFIRALWDQIRVFNECKYHVDIENKTMTTTTIHGEKITIK